MKVIEIRLNKILTLLLILSFCCLTSDLFSQGKTKWMAVGSLHNWYSEFGCEIEEGLFAAQQYGLRWPANHKNNDIQAAKSLWIGVKDFTDATQFGGTAFPSKVVHVGPRVSGTNEFFPVKWEMVSRVEAPFVSVDGLSSAQLPVEIEKIDPTLPYDRMIYNEVNTQLGATVKRKIYQFAQEYHDNYIINEVTIINTGNVDDDAEIELPNSTLKDLYAYWMYRWAVSANTRYTIGNGTGWGMNTMLDVRGDGQSGIYGDKPDENFRATYAWHGKFPPFTAYDNLGGPIWVPNTSGGLITANDTVGRLGAAQFVGVVTLHSSVSAADQSDDLGQPSTTSYEGSDEDYTSRNDAFNAVKMDKEYNEVMTKGHRVRHAWVVEPAGKFTEPTGDPSLGTPGGFSNANGYGPYTLAHGDSIKIVWAEAVNGLTWDSTITIGRKYKQGKIDAKTKNEWVMSGRDSLFKTFRRVISNWNSGTEFSIAQPPLPPSFFEVNSGGDRVTLKWEHSGDGPKVNSFEIWRAKGAYDSTYRLIYTALPTESEFADTTLTRGVDYYYFIQAVGDPTDNNGGALTPAGKALKSGKFYTQTYDPANLKRPAGKSLSEFRVVPNPYIISADENNLLFPARQNRLAFFDIPGECKIQIFTEIGELIKEIDHKDGSGDQFWDLNTSSNQLVVSGIYIAVVTDTSKGKKESGKKEFQKFAIIR
ncbi:MAG: hypothetical protein CO129_07655 [Ignavibacteriales bacterium CG_4_9_14_3_um_filter_34_10]|nr:MAG: hypothetical protein CO129_07655 [Ignavibacteriales bacterium CG_4_9_14_3_um_filter_34_10]